MVHRAWSVLERPRSDITHEYASNSLFANKLPRWVIHHRQDWRLHPALVAYLNPVQLIHHHTLRHSEFLGPIEREAVRRDEFASSV